MDIDKQPGIVLISWQIFNCWVEYDVFSSTQYGTICLPRVLRFSLVLFSFVVWFLSWFS